MKQLVHKMTQYKQNNACSWCNIASQYVWILHRYTEDLISVITSSVYSHLHLSLFLPLEQPIARINQTGRPFKCVNIVDSDINLILLSKFRFSPLQAHVRKHINARAHECTQNFRFNEK